MIANGKTQRIGRSRISGASTAEQFQNLRADYNGAKTTNYRRRRQGIAASGSGADFHYRNESDYLRLMELARDMDRNDVVVGQTVDRAVTNMIQGGFGLEPQTGDPGVNEALTDMWDEWRQDEDQVDIQGESDFWQMENLVPRAALFDGDHLVLPMEVGSLKLTEGHRARTPSRTTRNVVNGFLLDSNRKRLEVWLTKDDIDPNRPVTKVSDIQAVPMRDKNGDKQVFQVYDPKRVTQTRGVTALAPLFDTLSQFEDIQFAKLVQQQIVSCFAILHERDLGFEGGESPPFGGLFQQPLGDGTQSTVEGVAPGQHVTGQPGEKLTGFSPNVPNAEYFDHIKLTLTLIGINLGMPLVLLLMDAGESNFSGWRGAVEQARMGFRRNQQWLMRKFHRPVYKFKVRQWLAEDPALLAASQQSGVNIFKHLWHPPTWPYIEPLKDASADLLRVRNALISPRRLQQERGRTWPTMVEEIVEDHGLAIRRAKEAAIEINSEFDDDQPVHWRELISLPTADGINVSITGTTDELGSEQNAGN